MNKKYDQVNEAISQLEEIQARQVEDFDKVLMPDLDTHSLEREKGLDRLKQEAAGFIKWAGQEEMNEKTESIISCLNDRISRLLKQNAILTLKVKHHRDILRQSLNGLAKGKKAIGAYGSPASVSNRPRAINLTN